MSTQYQTIRRVTIISKTQEEHQDAMCWCFDNCYRVRICGPQVKASTMRTTGKYKIVAEKRIK